MDKAKTLIIVYFIIFFGILLSGIWFSTESILYWWLLLGWVYYVFVNKGNNPKTLFTAFILFIVGVILKVFNLNNMAEVAMRISLIGWLVGIGQTLVEYKKENDKKSE